MANPSSNANPQKKGVNIALNQSKALTFEEYKVMQHHKQKKIENAHKYFQRGQPSRRSVDMTSSHNNGCNIIMDHNRKSIINESNNTSRNMGQSHQRASTSILQGTVSDQKRKKHNFTKKAMQQPLASATKFHSMQKRQKKVIVIYPFSHIYIN